MIDIGLSSSRDVRKKEYKKLEKYQGSRERGIREDVESEVQSNSSNNWSTMNSRKVASKNSRDIRDLY